MIDWLIDLYAAMPAWLVALMFFVLIAGYTAAGIAAHRSPYYTLNGARLFLSIAVSFVASFVFYLFLELNPELSGTVTIRALARLSIVTYIVVHCAILGAVASALFYARIGIDE